MPCKKPGSDMTEASTEAAGSASDDTPKDATPSVVAQQQAMLTALPFGDTADFDDAARGFLGTIEHSTITTAQGRVVWFPSFTPPASR